MKREGSAPRQCLNLVLGTVTIKLRIREVKVFAALRFNSLLLIILLLIILLLSLTTLNDKLLNVRLSSCENQGGRARKSS
jgi:hypothetical protein